MGHEKFTMSKWHLNDSRDRERTRLGLTALWWLAEGQSGLPLWKTVTGDRSRSFRFICQLVHHFEKGNEAHAHDLLIYFMYCIYQKCKRKMANVTLLSTNFTVISLTLGSVWFPAANILWYQFICPETLSWYKVSDHSFNKDKKTHNMQGVGVQQFQILTLNNFRFKKKPGV